MIHVIVPAYDCYDAFIRCLDSVFAQDYQDFQVVMIDDDSPDPLMGYEVMRRVKNHRNSIGITQHENRGALFNIAVGIDAVNAAPEDIIFLLDGDDRLPHPGVLSTVAEFYEDPDVWMSYGSYIPSPWDPLCPQAKPYPAEIIDARAFRGYANLFNHPISFKQFLWDQLTMADLQDDDENFIEEIYDQAIMYPMMEIAGRHVHFSDRYLYVYNSANPLSVSRSKREAAQRAGEILLARAPREPVEDARQRRES